MKPSTCLSSPILALTLSFLLAITPLAHSWNATAHKIIMAIAWLNLETREQQAIRDILAKHPKYLEWQTVTGNWIETHRDTQDSYHLGMMRLEKFMAASVWPDEIRNYNDPKTHGNWHFINYPLFPDSGYAFQPALAPTDDILFGIKHCLNQLTSPRPASAAAIENEGETLAFLMHFVGDIHQPLHCSSLFNQTFVSAVGDRGGTHFYVKMKANSANPVKLHTLWDNLMGTGKDRDNLLKTAKAILLSHPRSSFPPTAFTSTPLEWSKESRLLAITHAYVPLPSLNGLITTPVVLPTDYFSDARVVATNRVALAGYRLADMLKRVLVARKGK